MTVQATPPATTRLSQRLGRLAAQCPVLHKLAQVLDDKCEELSILQLDYRDTFEHVSDKLRWEVHSDQEQNHLIEAAALYTDDVDVQIPALLDRCTSRVTAIERVFGVKVTDHRLDRAADKRRLVDVVSRSLVAESVFSRRNRAIFHGDPHTGNLLYTPDGRLTILDWSLTRHLSDTERIAMGQLILSAITLNAPRTAALIEKLDTQGQVNESDLRSVVDQWLRRVRRGQLPRLVWLVKMLDEATRSSRLRMGTDMMIFRKSLLVLEGVVRDLGGKRTDPENVLFMEFLCHFGQEWPRRSLSLPNSRAFATRLSNIDTAATMLSIPLAVSRFCQPQ